MAEYDDKEQKTEEATPRRRDEARERGQVALSTELVSGVGLCVGMAMLAVAGGHLMRTVASGLVEGIATMGSLGRVELSVPLAASMVSESIEGVGAALAAVVLPTILVGGVAGYAQVGFRIAGKAIELDPSKVNPVKGMQRLVGARAVVRTLLSAAKVLLIVGTVVAIAWMHVEEVVVVGTSELGPLLAAVGTIAVRCTLGALVVIIALGLVDLLFQRFQLGRDLRMTKQEVKEEQRLTDGDPHLRARIRQIQRELSTRRMMADVPDATVVVTNPTHYAVALRYDVDEADSTHAAPVVVAKGKGHVAQRIKEIAAEHDVPRHEDVQLARALYAQAEVGREIPEGLYAAVAAVLGQVYRLQGRVPASAVEA